MLSRYATPLVSIIIPTFNAGRFIQRALEGIRRQTYSHWEVIVVEDGSRDESEATVIRFAKSTGKNCRYERNERNLGVSATRNHAMSLARGELIAFLDADDWWTADHLTFGESTLRDGGDFCYSSFTPYNETGRDAGKPVAPTSVQLEQPLTRLFRENFIHTSSLVMLWRDVAERISGFDTHLRVGEDLDYWLRLLGTGHSINWTGMTTCFYSKHLMSAMANTPVVAEESVKFHRKHLASTYLPLSLRKRLLALRLLSHGRLLWRQDRERARCLIAEGYGYQPLDPLCAIYAAACKLYR